MLGYSLAMLELLDGPDFVHRCLWHNHGNLNTDWIFDIQELSLVLNMNSNLKLCFHSPDILRNTLTYSWVQGMPWVWLFSSVQASLSWRWVLPSDDWSLLILGVYDWDIVLVGGARDSLWFSQRVLENSSLSKRSKNCSLFSYVHLAMSWILNSNNFLSFQ